MEEEREERAEKRNEGETDQLRVNEQNPTVKVSENEIRNKVTCEFNVTVLFVLLAE